MTEENIKEKCKTCGGVRVISSGQPNMFNCEMGGMDCSGMTNGVLDNKDACDRCGKTVPCPECMPVANEYYHLFGREIREANIAKRKIDELEEKITEKDNALKGFLEIQQWCKDINVKSYGRYQTAIDERMAIAKAVVTEKISHAAIVRSDGILEIAKSHPEIIKRCPYGTCKAGSKQGFVTSTGRYVDRFEAAQIAILARQITGDDLEGRKSGLISENIWADTNHEYDPDRGYYIPDTIKNQLAYILGQIINDLPKNKDWLDPTIEKIARDLLKEIEK